jgi:hypothetical protein
MAVFNRFNAWTETMVEGANLASDQFAIALTNSAPSASNTVLADITQIAYTGVGLRNLVTSSSSQTLGTYSLVFASLTLGTTVTTATFRYVVIYDDTLAGDPLVGWYDLGVGTTIPANNSLIFSGMGLDLSGAFEPLSLYTGGYTGGYYDPSDLSTLWQNSARTTPVTADGDPVWVIDDKSGTGNHLAAFNSAARPVYRTSGGLHWLEFDGIDDRMLRSGAFPLSFASAAIERTTGGISISGLLANTADGAVDVDYAILFNGSTMQAGQGAGEGLSDGTHKWVDKVQTSTLAVGSSGVVSVDATGYTGGTLQFPNGIFLMEDRGLARYMKSKFYAGFLINRILTTTERENLETWEGNKMGISI